MRVVFMGSAGFSCQSLRALRDEDIVGVVTQPDRPRGRKLRPAPSAVRVIAEDLGLYVLTPENINSGDSIRELERLAPDLIVVVAYGQILKRTVLEIPLSGCLNLHASMLPEYRGAAPIQHALLDGRRETGLTTMYMDERMDAGDIIYQMKVAIGNGETAGELLDRLAVPGSELLEQTVKDVASGIAPRRPQDESLATYAPRLSKKDGLISWDMEAEDIYNRVRAFTPWPGAYCNVKGRRVVLLEVAGMKSGSADAAAGTVLEAGKNVLVIKTGAVAGGDDSVCLLRVKPAGKREMSGAEFARGLRLAKGERIHGD